jgi:hypothetical protein
MAGFAAITSNLNGVVLENDGLDVTLHTTNIKTKSFEWTTSFNITTPKSFLKSYPNLATSSYATEYYIGKSLNTITALTYTGVNPTTGAYTVEDVNKDGKITSPADYQQHGNTDPRSYGSLGNSFTYKAFRVDVLFQFMQQYGLGWMGDNIYNEPGSMYNQPGLVESRWQKPGDLKAIQKFTTSPGSLSGVYTGYYAMMFSNDRYNDASFIRLKNLAFSYDLSGLRVVKAAKISGFRLFLIGQNLFVITSYKGGDPETRNYLTMPPMRTLNGGLQLNF